MTPDMPFINTLSIESFTTYIAPHPPVSSKNRHMVFSILGLSERFCTDFTMVSNAYMFVQMNVLTFPIVEAFSTLVTLVYVAVLSGVYICMCWLRLPHFAHENFLRLVIQNIHFSLEFDPLMNVPPKVFVTSITMSINNDNWSIDVLQFSNIKY